MKVNILFTSIGRRVELINSWKKAYADLGINGQIIGTDIDPLAAASNFVDSFHIVPNSNHKDFIAQLVLNEFDEFYNRFKEITESAKDAFENCDFQESLQISQNRMSLYSVSMYRLGDEITKSFPDVSKNQEFWDGVEDNFRQIVEYRYEGDLALAYLHSVRRAIFRGEWTPVDYSFGVSSDAKAIFNSFLMVTFHSDDFDSSLVLKILRVLGFKAKFRQAENESKLAAVKIKSEELSLMIPQFCR